MKQKSHSAFRNPFLNSLLIAGSAMLGTGQVFAVDYGFGSVTENFTITASDQARVIGGGTTASGTLSPDNGAVYDRGANRDATYMHFNLASLSGMTINGDVNLNLVVNTQYGGAINNGIIGTAASAWTTTSATPGINAFTPTSAPNQTYGNGATATWAIGNSTFAGILGDLANFNGLGITAGAGSTAHFSAPATLTGSYTGTAIRVTAGTDWSAAAWTEGTKTLSISSGDVSGGNVTLASNTKLDVTGAATLGSGNFSGSFTNSGTLAFGSSANQILSGAISGSGALEKSGAGTLTLNGPVSYKGGTTVNGGTLELPGGDWVTGDPWTANGASGAIIVGSGATLSTSAGVTEIKNGLTLNGGTVSSRGITYGDAWSNLWLSSNITAGGTANSTISSQINLNGGRTVTVGTGSTLNFNGKVNAWNSGVSGITKEGMGTLALSAANGYTGVTDIKAGTLLASNNSALGQGGWDGNTMTWIRDTATLALQSGISLSEHMHITGAGVGGLGAIRSLSGDNTLSMTNGGGGSGPGYALDGNTTIGVDADTLTVTGFYHDSGSYGITKVGNGTLKLTQTSTYTGATTVSNGKLVVNGNISTSSTTVGNGGALGGSGTVGAVTVLSGGTLAIGNSPGTMTYSGDLTLNLGSISDFEINSFNPGEFDLALAAVFGTQTVNFNGGTLNLLFQSGFSTLGTLKIFDFDAYAGSGFTTVNSTGLASGLTASFNSLDGTITVVPEPRAALIGGLGLLALLRRRR